MPYAVTEVQPTPNPNAMKYVLDMPVSTAPRSYFNAASAGDDPLAKRLFEINGVSGVLLLGDFITINKKPDAGWTDVTKHVKNALKTA